MNFAGKRTAPPRPREQPPSLPRSPSPLGSMSSLQDVLKVRLSVASSQLIGFQMFYLCNILQVADMHSESRQSVASNNSSSVSSPPSPININDSSYDS